MRPRSVLVLGSGALKIGQAGEFDYSGSQAIKALSESGVRTVLINPNIATIQTSEGMADRLYLNPVTPGLVRQAAVAEGVDGVLLSFGGQTALNCGLELEDHFRELHIQVLGTPLSAVRDTEDRGRFNARLAEIGIKTARSVACRSRAEAEKAAEEIGLPLMLRAGFALGGRGSAIVETDEQLHRALTDFFSAQDRVGGQLLVEESLRGWKEIEYEVVRDRDNNCITVCNMENLDPMGIHTGESIVVAPSQTLNDEEYQLLRTVSIRTIQHLGIVGECNVQFALDPDGTDYRVIEVNARLSRSSALASKATGYPLAYVAAKLSLGFTLPELKNNITGVTTAFFEPALDYLTLKAPRWDLAKFQDAGNRIGSEMKSVGEVMAIGRTFPEVLQKALRMLDVGVSGLDSNAFVFEDLEDELANATPRRIFALARFLRKAADSGGLEQAVERAHALTRIDRWFLKGVARIVEGEREIEHAGRARPFRFSRAALLDAKKLGFSDEALDALTARKRGATHKERAAFGIRPKVARIDTLAAEFPAQTNYLYTTYHAAEDEEIEAASRRRRRLALEEGRIEDPAAAPVGRRRRILVIGSGVYRIGSSVEFDWCCVNAVEAAKELGCETLMLNYNPETVSTDYDICDRLVFDEISVESVLDLCERENPDGVVVSMGGQIPNRIAMRLHEAGIPLLGTAAEDIDRAEDRHRFSALLEEIGVDQPKWTQVTDEDAAGRIVDTLGGYPVIVRPSYVLSGTAMSVAHEPNELARILKRAKAISSDYPVVISRFEEGAREIEIDLVANRGEVVLWALSEHVEDAGVHSGDATLVLPPEDMPFRIFGKARRTAQEIARKLRITGPCNIQMLYRDGVVKVIECNLRASRSLPFVSKVTGRNYAKAATRIMLGEDPGVDHRLHYDFEHVGVKVPQFSFSRLGGADPILGVEMASTGEVGCVSDSFHEALLHGMFATGFRRPKRGVLLSLGPRRWKEAFVDAARSIVKDLGLRIYATPGTSEVLDQHGVPNTEVVRVHSVAHRPLGEGFETGPPSALDLIDEGRVDLVVNVPVRFDPEGRPDGYRVRRRAVDRGVPLITDPRLARQVVAALAKHPKGSLRAIAWNDFLDPATRGARQEER